MAPLAFKILCFGASLQIAVQIVQRVKYKTNKLTLLVYWSLLVYWFIGLLVPIGLLVLIGLCGLWKLDPSVDFVLRALWVLRPRDVHDVRAFKPSCTKA